MFGYTVEFYSYLVVVVFVFVVVFIISIIVVVVIVAAALVVRCGFIVSRASSFQCKFSFHCFKIRLYRVYIAI